MTHLHLLLHIVTLDTEALVVPWHQFTFSLLVPKGCLAIQPVHDSVLQVLIICMSFTSKLLLHLQEEVKVRWCQVRTVGRMVKCVPMELIMQQGLCLLAVCGRALSWIRTVSRESLPLRRFWIALRRCRSAASRHQHWWLCCGAWNQHEQTFFTFRTAHVLLYLPYVCYMRRSSENWMHQNLDSSFTKDTNTN